MKVVNKNGVIVKIGGGYNNEYFFEGDLGQLQKVLQNLTPVDDTYVSDYTKRIYYPTSEQSFDIKIGVFNFTTYEEYREFADAEAKRLKEEREAEEQTG